MVSRLYFAKYLIINDINDCYLKKEVVHEMLKDIGPQRTSFCYKKEKQFWALSKGISIIM